MIDNHPSSFRDPSGFIFQKDDHIYRCVNQRYSNEYDTLMNSGLYEELTSRSLLIPHQEVAFTEEFSHQYKIIQPGFIEFISYPYEWSFSQLKDAALVTLEIQMTAMKFGMSLKDATAYNVQFHKGKPVFVDTLSFEILEEKPWVAYKQFCQHFLGPLLLMKHIDPGVHKILTEYLDGIPLQVLSRMLPLKTWTNIGTLIHIHLHARSQNKYAHVHSDEIKQKTTQSMSYNQLLGFITSLKSAVTSCKLHDVKTEWGDYYNFHNYSKRGFQHKKQLISEYVDQVQPHSVLDIGGNVGEFSKILTDKATLVINTDIDPLAVEANYQEIKKTNISNMVVMMNDITNPPSGIGLLNQERESFLDRVHGVDLVMALALIHHLAISNNIPFKNIARMFSTISENLIIEFVPKSDSHVKTLLQTRADIFDSYNKESFEKNFGSFYEIIKTTNITESERFLYLMKRK